MRKMRRCLSINISGCVYASAYAYAGDANDGDGIINGGNGCVRVCV